MPKMDWGASAINHEVRQPEHTVQPMGPMTSGPIFDLTPHDAYTTPIMNPEKVPVMDAGTHIGSSMYGPPYGAMPTTVSDSGRLASAIDRMSAGKKE